MFKAAIAAVAALGLAAGTASAQYQTVVPHRGHYHVVPSYSPPVYGGYSYPTYSYPSYSPSVIGGYASPGFSSFGGYSSGFGYGSGFGSPGFGSGGYYGGSWGGHHHHHGHHHHR